VISAGKLNPTLDLYVALMTEVKIRIQALDLAAGPAGGMRAFSGVLVQEFCFLQLRMACEVIALACLVAHGEINATKAPKLLKEYAADKIMAALDKLHPRFFPRPIAVNRMGQGIDIVEVKSGTALTKGEFATLYGRCGAYLHRGNVKKLLSTKTPLQTNFPEVVKWRDRVIALLSVHHVASFDNNRHILCHMGDAAVSVNAVFAESPLLLSGPSGDRSSA
jgi:hypothetical protein